MNSSVLSLLAYLILAERSLAFLTKRPVSVICRGGGFLDLKLVWHRGNLRKDSTCVSRSTARLAKWNPFQEVVDIFSNLDDVIDDFMGKRMGNGELFYGKRKYKPSGRENTEGQYSGMGMSDKLRIDLARERKEQRLLQQQLKQQQKRRQQE